MTYFQFTEAGVGWGGVRDRLGEQIHCEDGFYSLKDKKIFIISSVENGTEWNIVRNISLITVIIPPC